MTYSQFVDQLYIECVLEDDLNSLIQDQSSNAIQKLEEIRDQLTTCVSSREELLDYYSQDEIFAAIVGTSDRYNNLCNYLDKANKEESEEVLTTGTIATMAVAGLCVGMISSLLFDRGVNGAYVLATNNSTSSNTFKADSTMSRYAINHSDAVELCKDINECISHLKHWAQYPHIFNKQELEQISKKLHIQVPDIKTSEKIAAGSKAVIKGFLKAYAHGSISGLIYGIVLSAFEDPAAYELSVSHAVGSITGAIPHYVTTQYTKEINKTAQKTLAEQGWTDDNFKSFSKELVVIIQNVRALYKIIKENKRYFKSKDDFNLCKSFYAIMMTAVKGLCKMYISLCYTAKTKKQNKN